MKAEVLKLAGVLEAAAFALLRAEMYARRAGLDGQGLEIEAIYNELAPLRTKLDAWLAREVA